jgi:hypothetical protein
MTPAQQQHLQDIKACVTRCLMEGKYDECLLYLAQDTSGLLMDPDSPRVTAGEHGRIVLATSHINPRRTR